MSIRMAVDGTVERKVTKAKERMEVQRVPKRKSERQNKDEDGKSSSKGKQKSDSKGKHSGKYDGSGKGKGDRSSVTCHKCGKSGILLEIAGRKCSTGSE